VPKPSRRTLSAPESALAELDDWRKEDDTLLLAAEEQVSNAALDGLNAMARNLRSALEDERLTDSEMASLRGAWESALDSDLLPAIEQVYAEAYDAQMASLVAAAKVSSDATTNAQRYVKTIRNRLVGVADEVFKDIQRELAAGLAANEDPDQLARRVDRVFKQRGGNNWLGRASVIAQTETAAAINAGRMQAARKYARDNDMSARSISKTWVTRRDDKVRDTHKALHGDSIPFTRAFVVGGAKMQFPGDPTGPPEQTINCRCTLRFTIPSRTASGDTMVDNTDGVVIVGLPMADDAIHGIGDEEKHVTLVWLGTLGETQADRDTIAAAVENYAGSNAGFLGDVAETGVLGDDEAKVAFLDKDEPTAVRNGLLENPDIAAANDAVKQYPNYTPHVTLTYDDETPEGVPQTIKFDRLGLWFGDDKTEYPFDGEPVDEDDLEDDDMTAPTQERETASQTMQPWYGVLAPEGVLSGDKRKFKDGSLRHRDLPLPIMYQDANAPGHDGAIRAGNIQGIQRVGGEMRAWGMLDGVGEGGKEAARQIEAEMLRGIDVDDATFGFETEDGQEIDSNDIETLLSLDEEPVMVITDGRISGATLCSIPAFQEAFVALGEPPAEWDVHSVSVDNPDEYATYLVFENVSDKPWSDFTEADYSDDQWFTACALHKNGTSKVKSDNGLPIREPGGTLNRNGVHAAAARFNQVDAPAEAKSKAKSALRGAYKALGEEVPDVLASARTTNAAYAERGLVASAGVLNDFVDPMLTGPTPLTVRDGRVFGHLATWGTCHIGFAGQCVTPPKSAHGYAYFHTGEVLTADGASVPVGHITLGTGHADPALAARPAAAHYDNTGAVAADVAAGDDEFGIWISGRVRPHADQDTLRAAALSGDWRRIGGSMELVAALAVNVPGFPIPRTEAAMVAGAQTALVAAGVVADRRPSADITLTLGQIEQAVQTAIRREHERTARLARAERVAASIQQDRASRAARAAALVEGV
jgi:hypothetical protein